MQGLNAYRAVNTPPRLYTANLLVYKAKFAVFPEIYTKHTTAMSAPCRIF